MRKIIHTTVFALAVFLCCPQPAKAGMPVIDPSHIAMSIINTAGQVAKWVDYIQTFRGYYSTFNSVYYGIRSWKDMEWVDMLRLTELPWFDGIPGIEDIRNIAGATSLTLDELNNLFAEIAWLDRMANDPRFRQNQAMMEQYRLMRKLSNRQMRRKMVMTQGLKKMQQENDSYTKQLKTIQSQIESLSKQDPVPAASIMALQSRIAGIQTKIQVNKDSLYAQIKIMQEQEEAERAQLQSEWQTSIFDMSTTDRSFRDIWRGQR